MMLPRTDRSLPFALLRAREKVMGPIRAMLSETGLTEQQWRVLRVLEENGGIDASTLADKANLLLPSLSRILNGMVEKGLVSRTAQDDDRRRQTVEVTPKGRNILSDHRAEAEAIATRIRNTLGQRDYEVLLSLLKKLDDL